MDYKTPKLYRRRYIPDECVHLKDDEIRYIDDKMIITQWKTLKPRPDFDHGCSCFYMRDGIKISRFYDKDGRFLYYYCDIIETLYNAMENAYIFNDLLADVIVYENGLVKILDIGEIAVALKHKIITPEQTWYALNTLDRLLDIIYSGNLSQLAKPLSGIFNLQGIMTINK